MPDFVHLHVHSEYSLLDGDCRLRQLISRCKELGMSAVAVTDHGNMYGAVEFYKLAKENGIKPIIGCEVYVAPRTRFDRVANIDSKAYHLILLCKNDTGYHNICKLLTAAYNEGFYSHPRIDFELLTKYHEGLVCLSGCLAGEISRKLSNGDYNGARETAIKYKSLFGDDYYIEVQDHSMQTERQILPYQYKLARDLNIKLVATNDCHYIAKSDARTQKLLVCIATATTESEPSSMVFETQEFWFKSQEDMAELFKAHPDAISNTVEIADKCSFDFDFTNTKLPGFSIAGVRDNEAYLRSLTRDGLKNRFGDNPPDEAVKRVEYELSVIAKMGFVNYYLIVWDFIRYAKSQGIPVGPGRGSGAGSLVAYCIGITGIDPLKYDLLFERFLNPERVSMPDFDIDFCIDRRQEVIDYVKRRYGQDHVAQIVTFDTMAAKSSIRDMARAMGLPHGLADKVAKAVPFGKSLAWTIENVQEFRDMYLGSAQIHELVDMAAQVEGMPRNQSTHPAGVVITDGPVSDYVPLKSDGKQTVTQFSMKGLESLKLLKIDFLGLRNLTVIHDAEQAIKKSEPEFSMSNISYDDPEVYKMLSDGDTAGVFQLESTGMTSTIMRLRPERLEDIIAVISLYRPGPMEFIDTYIENRHHPEKITYPTPLLKPILDVTCGVFIYQEQVMQIFCALAGYTYGRADVIRRAMSKKNHAVIESERKSFIAGCAERGVSEEAAINLFDRITAFGDYAYNKSHAASYAIVAYQTAYLKCHYFKEFMAALLTRSLESESMLIRYVNACRSKGVEILGPDINRSSVGFVVEGFGIRFGLLAIKSLGRGMIEKALRERETNGPFVSLYDFISRMSGLELNARAVEALIMSGAFDGFKNNRREMLQSYDVIMATVADSKRSNIDGQIGLFGDDEDEEDNPESETYITPAAEFSFAERLEMEKETMGIYISGHPLSEYLPWISAAGMNTARGIIDGASDDPRTVFDDQPVAIIGMLHEKKMHTAKNNKLMCFASFEDQTGSIEAIVFPNIYEVSGRLLQIGAKLAVWGKISLKEDEDPKILADKIILADDCVKEMSGRSVCVRICSTDHSAVEAIKRAAKEHSGKSKLYVYLYDTKKLTVIKDTPSIALTSDSLRRLSELLGWENVRLK